MFSHMKDGLKEMIVAHHTVSSTVIAKCISLSYFMMIPYLKHRSVVHVCLQVHT